MNILNKSEILWNVKAWYLILVTDIIFGIKKNWSTLTVVLFQSEILAMFYRSFYISRERVPVSMRTILNVWFRST